LRTFTEREIFKSVFHGKIRWRKTHGFSRGRNRLFLLSSIDIDECDNYGFIL
jgi:hypothetical protein